MVTTNDTSTKHGRWVISKDMYGCVELMCSECTNYFFRDVGDESIDCYCFCPYCGAKMDLGGDQHKSLSMRCLRQSD